MRFASTLSTPPVYGVPLKKRNNSQNINLDSSESENKKIRGSGLSLTKP